jgi:ankyrin repeat protein
MQRKYKYLLLIFLLVIGIGGVAMTYHANDGMMKIGEHYYSASDFFTNAKDRELAIAIKDGDLNKIDKLVREGANVNAIGKQNMSILKWASIPVFAGSDTKVFEHLLRLGASPNLMDNEGGSPMMFFGGGKNAHLLELLLKYGGNPNMRNTITRNVLERNVTVLISAAQGGYLENVKLLLKYGAKIDLPDDQGETPLLWAADTNHFDVAYYLLEKGANYKHRGHIWLTNREDGLLEIIYQSLDTHSLSDDRIPWRDKVIAWLKAHGEEINEPIKSGPLVDAMHSQMDKDFSGTKFDFAANKSNENEN